MKMNEECTTQNPQETDERTIRLNNLHKLNYEDQHLMKNSKNKRKRGYKA